MCNNNYFFFSLNVVKKIKNYLEYSFESSKHSKHDAPHTYDFVV